MDELEMTSGVIPLRHSSLPGHIKLPRRYEKAATGSNGIPARVRKISIQPGQSALGDSLSDRLDDLMAAFMWVKQELIMLRQHDILLKRQFFNIQDLIQSLRKPAPSSTTTTTTTTSTTTTATSDASDGSKGTNTGVVVEGKAEVTTGTAGGGDSAVHVPANNNSGELCMTTFFVRQALSVSVLHEDSDGEDGECLEEGEDVFADVFFRHRTSSMRTSRDMAALARRRGSKELI